MFRYVFLAAAKVGGIGANSAYSADFIYVNTMIGFNVGFTPKTGLREGIGLVYTDYVMTSL